MIRAVPDRRPSPSRRGAHSLHGAQPVLSNRGTYVVTRLAFGLVLMLSATASLHAQAAPATAPLTVFGIPAGAKVFEVSEIIADRDGGHLQCDRSKVDVRVEECRATVTVPEAAEPLELWMSAIDSTTSILTIAGNLAPDEAGPAAKLAGASLRPRQCKGTEQPVDDAMGAEGHDDPPHLADAAGRQGHVGGTH